MRPSAMRGCGGDRAGSALRRPASSIVGGWTTLWMFGVDTAEPGCYPPLKIRPPPPSPSAPHFAQRPPGPGLSRSGHGGCRYLGALMRSA